MPLSSVQHGRIGENEAWKYITLTSDGELEADLPASDDEARDADIHERGHYGTSIGLQIKESMTIYHDRGKKAPMLAIEFRSRHPVLVSHPLYWFLFAFFDLQTMTFRDPLFLIPSEFLFAHIATLPIKGGKEIHFLFRGNMSPDSHDMWAPYRVSCRDLGPRLLQILHEAEQSQKATRFPDDFTVEPRTIWVARRRLHKVV